MSTTRKILYVLTIPVWLPLLCVGWIIVGGVLVVAATISLLLPR